MLERAFYKLVSKSQSMSNHYGPMSLRAETLSRRQSRAEIKDHMLSLRVSRQHDKKRSLDLLH